MSLKILGRATSINVRKVLWTCAELGVAAAHEPWGQGALATSDPAFLALNPNGLVPVLQDGDSRSGSRTRSAAISRARHGVGSLLPREARARARVEQWMDWQATELNNAWRYAFMALVRKSAAHTDAAMTAASVEELNEHVRILDAHSRRGVEFVAGTYFTLADVVLGLSTHPLELLDQVEHPHLDAVNGYYIEFSVRPAFRAHVDPNVP